jgi:hypothetical protein
MSVPGYVGNTLKEYSDLMNNKQEKFDTGVELAGRYGEALQNVTALKQDEGALKNLYDEHSAKLADWAGKGNYEDLVPQITRSARQFANDYQPFAQAYAQKSAYATELRKQVGEGKLSEQDYQRGVAASDASYKGLQKDPVTGKHVGTYSGMTVLGTPDMNKLTEAAMKDRVITEGGTLHISDNGEYVMIKGKETKTFTKNEMAGIVKAYANNSPEMGNYLQNYSMLNSAINGGYALPKDFDLSKFAKKEYVYDKDGKVVTTTDKNGVVTPKTEDRTYKDLMDKGIDLSSFRRQQDVLKEQDRLVNNAITYGGKYIQHDSKDILKDLSESNTHKDAKLQGAGLGFIANMGRPGSAMDTPAKIEDGIGAGWSNVQQKVADINTWMNGNPTIKIKALDANGNDAHNDVTKAVKFVDSNGNDVTVTGKKFLLEHQQSLAAMNSIKQRQDILMNQAGLRPIAGLSKQVQEETKSTLEEYKTAQKLGALVGKTPEQATTEAKDRIIEKVYKKAQPEQWDMYKKAVEAEAKHNVVPSVFQRFKDESINKMYDEGFSALGLNLDGKELGDGMLNLHHADGTPVSADEYKKMIGKEEFAGASFVNGKWVAGYKVGPETMKDGKLVQASKFVYTDAPIGTTNLLVKKGMVSEAAMNVAQQFPIDKDGQMTSRIQVGPGANDYVTVRRVLQAERDNGSQRAKTQYLITDPSTNITAPADSEDEGTMQILNLIKGKVTPKLGTKPR